MPIRILPPELVNKIAAGEVIERPASVVKELVENSIDAGASQISIEIQSAGKKLIRVSDDGCGMSKEDLKRAIERHSTSKIASENDLFNIRTLGFRGEALPSICSVAKVEITSKSRSAGQGSLIRIEGGEVKEQEDIGVPEGTSVSIKELFYNTPARKKFLKSEYAETGQISSIVSKFILSHPEIKFKLISDGKPIYISSGNKDLLDAIASVYGTEIAKGLLKIETPMIKGFVSRPNLSRLDRTYESFFVNGRYVRNYFLSSSLGGAYRSLIPNNRYPIAILFIEVNPEEVDVNVHPSKREVKFQKSKEVMDEVSLAIKQTLVSVSIKEDTSFFRRIELPSDWQPEMPVFPDGGGEVLFPEFPPVNAAKGVEIEITEIQPLLPIYQFKQTYLIATDGEDLYLIDQHAAHERILFDRLKAVELLQDKQSQFLLIPETLDFAPGETETLQQNFDYLKNLGFDIEDFGVDSIIIRAIPVFLAKSAIKDVLLEIVSELKEESGNETMEIKKERILKLMACHGAVKAGDPLSKDEINQLIRDLYKTQNPLTCPHGRPTMVKFTEVDFEKMFKRRK